MKPRAIHEARTILFVLGGIWLFSLLFIPVFSLPVAICVLGILIFFRDPTRCPPRGVGLAVAPADGRVVAVEECDGDGRMGGPVKRVVIFLSLWDVHVNRSPIAGTVSFSEPRTGEYVACCTPLSSTNNSWRTWVIEGAECCVVVRQISGALARRIVAWRRVGDMVGLGERIGMIRFGSRTEVDFPLGVEILVGVGDRVRAGETVIARYRAAGGADCVC